MPAKRLFLAVAVGFAATVVLDVLLNAIAFRQVYVDAAPYLLPTTQLNHRVPLGWLAMLIALACYAAVFSRSAFSGVSGGIRFGVLLAIIGVSGVAGIASVVPWPRPLLAAMAVQQAGNGLLLGLVLGWFSRTAIAPTHRDDA